MASKKTTKKSVKKTSAKAKKKIDKPKIPESQESKPEVIAHKTKDNITPHDKFNSLMFIIGLLAVIVLLIVISPLGDESSETQNRNPEVVEGTHLLLAFDNPDMKVGDTVSLAIDAKRFKELVGFDFSVGFDSKVLKFKSLSYGDFLSGVQGKICVPHKNLGGLIDNIACIRLPDEPGVVSGASGSGNLATLTFDVVGRGDVSLQLSDVKLLNPDRENIDHQVILPKVIVR